MAEKRATPGRSGYRLRVVGTAGGVGAMAIVAIMALSAVASAGVASPGVFRGAVWSPFLYKDQSGCATAGAAPSHWSKLTGDGKMSNSASAATCSKARGGSTFESYASAENEIQVDVPVHLHTGTGGVNVTWSIVASGSDAATYTGLACPNTYTYSYNYNYGYTWFNYSDTYSYCSVEAGIDLFGEAYVHDSTTGVSTYPTNYWTSVYNDSGVYNDTYHDQGNYSNSSYWASNYSYSGSYNYSYGPGGTISGSWAPTWFINGTFVHSNKYMVDTYLYLETFATVEGYTGHASATLNAATGPNHADLLPFSIW
jgi:hypothetical protein